MAGYPSRIVRSSFGPTLIDEIPVKDPRKEIPAAAFNLLFWQVAGLGMTGALAVVGVQVAGSAATTVFQALAFDPEQALPNLVWSYDATGQYSFNFPQAQYPDEQGNNISLVFVGGAAFAAARSGGHNLTGQVVLSGAKQGSVYLETVAAAAADANFLMLLW